ncbi:hypothetical protein ALC57_15365 [Trachymyrmex cornetzi]|uniref:Uncharacterized protein n=1 Tax=Trachymyrmex cornetzi TaxID=471704 RepID=A0A195DIJ1_9HYME|nr:hypothetical protein ALC57_15365 [Trachymyrmex cornetzi]
MEYVRSFGLYFEFGSGAECGRLLPNNTERLDGISGIGERRSCTRQESERSSGCARVRKSDVRASRVESRLRGSEFGVGVVGEW